MPVKHVKIIKTLSVYEDGQHRITPGAHPKWIKSYGRPSTDGGIAWVGWALEELMDNGAIPGDEIEIIIRKKPKARKLKSKKAKK